MELKPRKISSVILILCISMMLVTIFGFRVGDDHEDQGEPYRMKEQDREVVAAVKPTLREMLKNWFSLYTSSPLRVTSYLEKVKALAHHVHACLVPPNLDFREGTSNIEAVHDQLSSGGGGGGAGEKVKMAVSKSLEESKATVEFSAESAAKLVGDTVQKTKEKVKKSLSDREAEPHKPEL